MGNADHFENQLQSQEDRLINPTEKQLEIYTKFVDFSLGKGSATRRTMPRYQPVERVDMTALALRFIEARKIALEGQPNDAWVSAVKKDIQATLSAGVWKGGEWTRKRAIHALRTWNNYTSPKKTPVPLPDLPEKIALFKIANLIPKDKNISIPKDLVEDLRVASNIIPDLDIDLALNNALIKKIFSWSDAIRNHVPVLINDSQTTKRLGFEYTPLAYKLMDMARGGLDDEFQIRLRDTTNESRWYFTHKDTIHLLGCLLFMLRVDKDQAGKIKNNPVFALDEYLKIRHINLAKMFTGLRQEQPIDEATCDIIQSVFQITQHFSVDEIEIDYINQANSLDFDPSDIGPNGDEEEQDVVDFSYEIDLSPEWLDKLKKQFNLDKEEIPWSSIHMRGKPVIKNIDAFLATGIYAINNTMDVPVTDRRGKSFVYETGINGNFNLNTFEGEHVVLLGDLFTAFFYLKMNSAEIAETYNIPKTVVVRKLQFITYNLIQEGYVTLVARKTKELENVQVLIGRAKAHGRMPIEKPIPVEIPNSIFVGSAKVHEDA